MTGAAQAARITSLEEFAASGWVEKRGKRGRKDLSTQVNTALDKQQGGSSPPAGALELEMAFSAHPPPIKALQQSRGRSEPTLTRFLSAKELYLMTFWSDNLSGGRASGGRVSVNPSSHPLVASTAASHDTVGAEGWMSHKLAYRWYNDGLDSIGERVCTFEAWPGGA